MRETSHPIDSKEHTGFDVAGIFLTSVLLLCVALWSPPLRAATSFDISTTSMANVDGDGVCTLIEALIVAQTANGYHECINSGGPYTINVPPGIYVFTAHAYVDNNFGRSAFGTTITDLTITGTGPNVVFQRDPTGAAMRFMIGGGARMTTISNVTITGFNASNTPEPVAAFGGAIALFQHTINLDRVTLSDNTAGSSPSRAGEGAAIVAYSSVVNVHRSTISNNTAFLLGNVGSQFRMQSSTLNMANSTVDGTQAAVSTNSSSNLSNVTLSGSRAILDDASGVTNVRNSILNGACQIGGIFASVNNAGPASCSGALAVNTLLSLADNGGPTQTRMIAAGEGTQDAAPSCQYLSGGGNPLFADGDSITTDQRGFPRDASCDLGAVELFDVASIVPFGAAVGAAYAGSITAAGSSGPYTYAVANGALPNGLALAANGSVSGTPSLVGSYAFTVQATDSLGFTSSRRMVNFVVTSGNQSITLGANPGPVMYSPGGTFAVSATASSGLPVTFTSATAGVCTTGGTNGSTVTIVAAGLCTLNASQAGNANYNAAPQQQQNVTINPGTQTIVPGPNPGPVTYSPGGTFAMSATGGGSGNPVIFTSFSLSTCTTGGTNGATVTMVGAGVCAIHANQAGNASYSAAPLLVLNVTINPATQTIVFGANPGPVTYSPGGTFAVSATGGGSGNPVTFTSATTGVCTTGGTNGSTVTIVTAGTCTINANQMGHPNFFPATQQQQGIAIDLDVQVIVFNPPASRALSEPPLNVTATGGGSGNPVTFTSLTPTVCMASGVNGSLITMLLAGTCTLRASQAGNFNYWPATSVDRNVLVGGGISTVMLDSSINPAPYLSPVTLTARVDGATPGGITRFKNGATTLCESAVSNGVATCAVSDLMEGAHGLRAEYLGDANNLPSFSAELIQRIRKVGIHQGAWWGGPQENGWGLSIMEQGDTLVAGWYYFDAAGRPTWLILPGCSWNANKTVCTGTLQRATSTWFGNYRATDARLVPVGTATFAFNSADLGRFDYTVEGTSGSKIISRLELGGNPLAPFDLTNVWWGGLNQNGWGLSLFVAGPALAGVWYTYDTQGQPTWVLFNGGEWQNPSRYRSQLSRLTGSPMIGATYDVNQLRIQAAGEMYFEFTDFNSGRMVYLIDGLLQVKDISKQRF